MKPAELPRLREIVHPSMLAEFPITAEELACTAVVVRSSALSSADAEASLQEVIPWMSPWAGHDRWKRGRWTCEVSDRSDYYSTGELSRFLAFHTDMSGYVEPPEFVGIRCIRPDPGGGGRNYLLHVDCARHRLEVLGRQDILAVLQQPRVLHGPSNDVAGMVMLPPAHSPEPARIFDAGAVTKSRHLYLDGSDRLALSDFEMLCRSWVDLQVQVALQQHDWLLFSNYRWLHGRGECQAVGRLTEVYWGVRSTLSASAHHDEEVTSSEIPVLHD